MARYDESVDLDINASPEACFNAMIDFASYPEWQKAVKRVRVIEERPEGPVVEFTAGLIVRDVRYVLAYRLDARHHRISWDYVEGDAKSVEGEFRADPLEGGRRTRATYRLSIDPGFWVPGPLIGKVREAVMRGVLKDLKKRVEG